MAQPDAPTAALEQVRPPGSLTTDLWAASAGTYAAILEHPFLAGLTDGSLPEPAFRFYVIQDAHYLRGFARALALAAARAPSEEAIALLAAHAVNAIEVERALHEGFFAEMGLAPAEVVATPLAPTCRAYVDHLLAVAHGGTFAEALAAVLPCYWIYREVGCVLVRRGSPDPRYQRWIDTYAGDEFGEVVRQVLDLADGLDVSARERAAMQRHFALSSRYEWMFWDMGFRREAWPV